MIAYAYKDMKSAEMMLNLYFFSIKGFFIATPNTFRVKKSVFINKGNNKITELRTILQRESQNS